MSFKSLLSPCRIKPSAYRSPGRSFIFCVDRIGVRGWNVIFRVMEALWCKETLSFSLILLSDSTMGVFWSLEWCQIPEHFWPFLTHHFSNLISSTYAILDHSKSHLFLWTHCNLFVFSVCDLFVCAMELRPTILSQHILTSVRCLYLLLYS